MSKAVAGIEQVGSVRISKIGFTAVLKTESASGHCPDFKIRVTAILAPSSPVVYVKPPEV